MVEGGRRDQLAIALLATGVALAVFAVGGAFRWTQVVLALLGSLLLFSLLTSRRRIDRRSPLLVLLGLAAAWTTLQLVPLPRVIPTLVSPTTSMLRDEGSVLAGIEVSSTLSMDPASTLRYLTFLVMLGAFATAAVRLAASRQHRYGLMVTVAGVCGLAAVTTGLHSLLAADALYGIYAPSEASPPILGPLLNSNHLGSLMSIGVATSLGLALHAKQAASLRAMWGLSAVLCGVIGIATQSRGAALAIIIGTLVVAALAVAARLDIRPDRPRERTHLLARSAPLAIMIVCGVVLTTYVGSGALVHQLETTSFDEFEQPGSKYAAWRSALELVHESPWTGVGRGAVEATLTRVHPGTSLVSFSHLENEGLQAVVEWGIPAALAMFLLLGWLAIMCFRRWRDGPLAAGALGALTGVVFQSNFDFALHLPGVALPVIVVLATVAHRPLRSAAPPRPRVLVMRTAVALLPLAAAGLLLLPWTKSLAEERDGLRGADVAAIQAATHRHPLDYFTYALLAQRLLAEDSPQAVAVLNHALRLHPTHPGLHRMAARLLVRAGRPRQAAIEYAAALRGSRDRHPVLAELVRELDEDTAVAAMPASLDLDETVQYLVELDRASTALAWVQARFEAAPDLAATEALYSLALRQNQLEPAERAARRRCELVPNTKCFLDLALILAKEQRHEAVIAALSEIAEWTGHREDRLRAWLLLCDALAAMARTAEARHCLRRLDGSGLVDASNGELRRRLDALPPLPNP